VATTERWSKEQQVMATNNNDRSADGELNQETTDAVVKPHHVSDDDPVIAAGLPGEGKRRSALTDEERGLLAWIEAEDRHASRQIDSGPIPPDERDRTPPATTRKPKTTDTTYTVAVTFTVPADSYDYLLSAPAIQREFQMWLKSLGATVHTVTVKPSDEKETTR
jgi:hypothetical protein